MRVVGRGEAEVVQEQFALYDRSVAGDGTLHLVQRPGFCTMKGGDGAEASVHDVRAGRYPASLASATTVLQLEAPDEEPRFVMIQRDAAASIGALQWQFPAGRMQPGELPSSTAMREMVEEVGVRNALGEIPLQDARAVKQNGDLPVALTIDGITTLLDASYTQEGATTEFFVDARLAVQTLQGLQAFDKEPFGRTVKLLTRREVAQLRQQGAMTDAAAKIWDAYNVQRMVDQLRAETGTPVPADKPGDRVLRPA